MRGFLASRAASDAGRALASASAPLPDAGAVSSALDATAELLAFRASGRTLPCLSFPDIRPHLGRAAAESTSLDSPAFFEIARLLRLSGEILDATTDLGDAPHLLSIRSGIHRQEWLLREIEKIFDDRGEMRDDASLRLRQIRQEIARIRDDARRRLQEILAGLDLPQGQAFVTLRNDRYVIPVPQGARGRAKGIVHDHSVSGATVFMEPFQIVDLNNRLIEMEGEDAEERRRILTALTDRARASSNELEETVERLAELDALAARATLAEDLRMVRPRLDGGLRLEGARHPVLAEAERRGAGRAVPLDLDLGGRVRTVVITGPNMGGKTVALKTVGLLAIMARAGLFVPADENTAIPLYRDIVADIGDEQSIEHDLSTFKSHVLQLKRALEAAAPGVLALLDELGAATDPDEGGALGRAVLESLAGRGATTIVTTHLGTLKTYAADAADAVNASMEFDPETLRPRFRLIVGVPGLSRALEVARGLGVDPDVLLRAESLIPEEERRAGSLLRDIEALRREAGGEAEAARKARAEAEESLARAESLMAAVRGEEAALRQGALEQSRELIRETRRHVEQVRAELRAERRGERAREAVSKAVRRLEDQEATLEKAAPAPAHPRVDPSRLAPGTRWWAESLRDFVTLLDGPDRHDMVRVRRGAMTVRLPASALSERSEASTPVLPQGVTLTSPVNASYESDVRGLTADEATAVVDKHLDTALLAGLGEIKVIHGMGTGVLLATVRGILSQHPRVKSFRSGESREGGAGVTIAELED